MRSLKPNLLILLVILALTACGGGGGGGDGDSGGGSDNSSNVDNGNDSDDGPTTPTVNYVANGPAGVNAPEDRSKSGAGAHLTLFSTGVDTAHQEFNDLTVADQFGATDDDGTSYPAAADDSGIGTFYAGLALGGNVGIAPAATLNNVRVFRSPEEREVGNSREALTYTKENLPTDVLLLSYEPSGDIDNAEFGIELPQAADKNDWLVVISGGNVPDSIQRRGTYRFGLYSDDPGYGGRMIVVGATDGEGELLDNSAAAYTPSSYIDELNGHFIVAPGQAICSSGVDGGTSQAASVCNSRDADGDESSQSSYFNATGTGPATALVGGAAATIRGAYPALDAATVVDVLLCSADDLGEPGYDALYGAGRLNVKAAIKLGKTIAEGGDFGDCDVPEETPDVTPDPDDTTNDSTSLPPLQQASLQIATVSSDGLPEPASKGEAGCKAYIRDDSGMLYFRDRRGHYALSEAGCMPALH